MTEQRSTGTRGAREPDGRTERLELHRPAVDDVPGLHAILADPRVWTHHPSLRHVDVAQTAAVVGRWLQGWATDPLGYRVLRRPDETEVLGYGGCGVREGAVRNLGYRLSPAAQGQGYATEVAREGVRRARGARPDLPVTAYLLQHDRASAAVARKAGLLLAHEAPDAGNPDATAVRQVWADRPLAAPQLAAVLR